MSFPWTQRRIGNARIELGVRNFSIANLRSTNELLPPLHFAFNLNYIKFNLEKNKLKSFKFNSASMILLKAMTDKDVRVICFVFTGKCK